MMRRNEESISAIDPMTNPKRRHLMKHITSSRKLRPVTASLALAYLAFGPVHRHRACQPTWASTPVHYCRFPRS